MPLSDHEQRLLEQMERALYAEDPKFASSLQAGRPRGGNHGRLGLGLLVGFGGIALLTYGAMSGLIAVGVVGFLVMLAGVFVAITAFRAAPRPAEGAPAVAARRKGRLNSRLEGRWARRREDGTF